MVVWAKPLALHMIKVATSVPIDQCELQLLQIGGFCSLIIDYWLAAAVHELANL